MFTVAERIRVDRRVPGSAGAAGRTFAPRFVHECHRFVHDCHRASLSRTLHRLSRAGNLAKPPPSFTDREHPPTFAAAWVRGTTAPSVGPLGGRVGPLGGRVGPLGRQRRGRDDGAGRQPGLVAVLRGLSRGDRRPPKRTRRHERQGDGSPTHLWTSRSACWLTLISPSCGRSRSMTIIRTTPRVTTITKALRMLRRRLRPAL